MFKKQNEKMIIEAFDKRAENIGTDIPDVEFSEAYLGRKKDIISREGRRERPTMTVIIRRTASIAAVVCAVVAVGVAANIVRASKDDSFAKKMNDKFENSPVYTEMPEGTLQKTTVTLGKEKVELEYVRSNTEINGVVVNEYKDSKGAEYNLDQSGNVIWYSASTADRDNSEGGEVLSEKQIHDLVLKKYTELYPELAKDSVLITCNCSEVTERFIIGFGKLYGKDNFIVGENFKAVIKNNGFINAWAMNQLEAMADFDSKILESLDKKTVEEYALKIMNAKYSEPDRDYEIVGVYLANVDDRFALEILVNYDESTETVYYELN